MRYIERLLDGLARLLHVVAVACLAAMVVLINTEILLRYLFGTSTLVADEYSGYLFSWIALLGFYVTARGGHFLRVEFGLQRLPPRGREAALLIGAAIGLGISVVLCDASWRLTHASWRFGSTSGQYSETPLYLPQGVMVAAFGLLAIAYLDELVRHGRRLFGTAP